MSYVSLNATLRDLLDQCDEFDVVEALIQKDPKTTGTGEGYRDVMAELLALPPAAPRYPILLQVYQKSTPDAAYVDVGFWNPAYEPPPEGLVPEYGLRGGAPSAGHYDGEADKHQQHFGMGLSPWSEIIDATVYASDLEAVTRLCPTLAHVLAEILWEITFYGYSDEAITEVADGLKATMDEYFLTKDPDLDPGKPDNSS
jgi:hypothetical protein